jgi:integrase
MNTKFNFTKEALSNLPLPTNGVRTVYHDAKTTGLQLRVTHAGIKTFSVFRRIKGGAPERMTLGRFPDMTIDQARRLAAKVNAEIEEGTNPAKVKRAHKSEITFGEAFTDFLANRRSKSKKPLSERTKKEYQAAFRLHLGGIKAEHLSRISHRDIERIHASVGRNAPIQANRVKALVSSVFSHAAELHGFSGTNPAAHVRGYAEHSRDRFAQAGELPRLFEALATDPMRDFFLIALLTGARRSNVLAMRWDELNLDEGLWRIPKTKNGDPQNVTLSPEAAEILAARRKVSDKKQAFVFPGDGKTGHLVEPRKAWVRIFDRDEIKQLTLRIKEAGGKFLMVQGESFADTLDRARKTAKQLKIETDGCRIADLRIHDLRRTLGSWQAKQGASLAIIGKSLNHKNQQTTAIYARLDLDPVRASVNSATAAMMEAAGVTNSARPSKSRQQAK